MPNWDPITILIEGLRGADNEAAIGVWNNLATQLLTFARGRLRTASKRVYDQRRLEIIRRKLVSLQPTDSASEESADDEQKLAGPSE